ncbi:Uncharacterised protein [Raoultella terrigena]|uniref:Uncharacterized protein n=1 Tax=Raoultella terrigena TaxID=577 RepID=A0A3P8JRW1_RAOTE|nr:Uncharacterised protein [Raoultella terrigena]
MDGALLSKPQRLTEVEACLTGFVLDEKRIEDAVQALNKIMHEAIGGRWSAPYKIPVFEDMFRQMMQETLAEQKVAKK